MLSDNQIDGLVYVPPPDPRQTGLSRKTQATAYSPFVLGRYRGGHDVTSRECSDWGQGQGITTTSSAKGTGDALGRGKGGIGLYRTAAGTYPACLENAVRVLQYIGNDGLAKLATDAGFESAEAMKDWVKTLPLKFTAA